MAVSDGTKRFDDKMIQAFIERFCGNADKVYRLAFVLTLSQDSARKLTDEVFRDVADDLPRLYRLPDPLPELIKRTWEKFSAGKMKSDSSDKTQVGVFLGTLNLEERVSLAVIDVMGMTRGEAADVLGCSLEEGDKRLAAARAKMMQHAFGKVDLAPEIDAAGGLNGE